LTSRPKDRLFAKQGKVPEGCRLSFALGRFVSGFAAFGFADKGLKRTGIIHSYFP
jgi:hypothetical protein